MSYDVALMVGSQTPCPTCGHSAFEGGKEVYSRNHTSNTAQMWRDAGCDLAEFDGKLAFELADSLQQAISKIEASPDDYRKYEPSNGWGDLDTTLAFLRGIYEACTVHPRAVVRVWH